MAEVFEKRHKHVIRDIRELIEAIGRTKSGPSAKFIESTYINQQNKEQPMYYMNRDGFTLLVMRFKGDKAFEWQLKYIEAFNKMEKKIIELIAERKSEEWRAIRSDTKRGYKKMTEMVQTVLLPLAREQGSTASEKVFYMNYAKLINKHLGISPKSRDTLSLNKLYEVEKMQDIAGITIKGLAAKGEDYHKIYRDTKDNLENYSRLSFLEQRFLN